jgi:hypothetical protein
LAGGCCAARLATSSSGAPPGPAPRRDEGTSLCEPGARRPAVAGGGDRCRASTTGCRGRRSRTTRPTSLVRSASTPVPRSSFSRPTSGPTVPRWSTASSGSAWCWGA